jgi:hypothetical protein
LGHDFGKTHTKNKKPSYPPEIEVAKCLAPAKVQVLASSLIISKIVVGIVLLLLKVRAFLSFPIDKHEKGGDGLPPTAVGKSNGGPPTFHLLKIITRISIKVDKTKPILKHIPNADGVETLE